jgi:HK97 family phage major capsid protein
MFLGYDVVISQKMPTSTSALDAVVVFLFGDMSKAVTFGTRGGLRVAQSEHRYFEYRQIGIVGSERIAIVVHDIGDASNAGPLVGLRGNTS